MDGNVSFIVTLISIMNTMFSAGCPDTVTIITPDDHTAGDELTCSTDGYPATYQWTVDGVDRSTTSTQVIQEGQHEYVCTVTVTINETDCSNDATATVAGYSKFQTQYMILCTNPDVTSIVCRLTGILMLPEVTI